MVWVLLLQKIITVLPILWALARVPGVQTSLTVTRSRQVWITNRLEPTASLLTFDEYRAERGWFPEYNRQPRLYSSAVGVSTVFIMVVMNQLSQKG